MKRLVLSLVAAVALVGGQSSTASAYDHFASGMAQDVYASTTQLPLVAINDCTGYAGCDTGCDSCGDCCSGGCYFEVEFLFLQYLRAEDCGWVTTANEQVNGNMEVAPRISLVTSRLAAWAREFATLSSNTAARRRSRFKLGCEHLYDRRRGVRAICPD